MHLESAYSLFQEAFSDPSQLAGLGALSLCSHRSLAASLYHVSMFVFHVRL